MQCAKIHEAGILQIWGQAHYLSVTGVPYNTEFYEWMGKQNVLFLSNRRDRELNKPRTLAWKAGVRTSTSGSPADQCW